MSREQEPTEDFHAILELAPEIVALTRPDGDLVYLNQAGRDFYGAGVDLLVDGWSAVGESPDSERPTALWLRRFAEADSWDAEFRQRRRDGEPRRMMFRARAMRDGSGTLRGWVLSCTDVEDQRRVGDALRRQAIDSGLLLAAVDEAASRERIRIFTAAALTVLAPLSETVRRLREPGSADPDLGAVVEAALAELRRLLDPLSPGA
jgi:PAS domain S-box-containing protein